MNFSRRYFGWSILVFAMLSFTACQQDACEEVACQNGGLCIDGDCECPAGYAGDECQTLDLTQVQALLDANFQPLELVNLGVPVASLYGKSYEGGLIFFLDVDSVFSFLDGFIAYPEDLFLQDGIDWGCLGTDITGIANVTLPSSPNVPDNFNGARLADGFNNTEAILNECPVTDIAADQIRSLGAGWFLPSRAELRLIYQNLYQNNLGDLKQAVYWSSTEYSSINAWAMNFFNGEDEFLSKAIKQDYVRAAKAF